MEKDEPYPSLAESIAIDILATLTLGSVFRLAADAADEAEKYQKAAITLGKKFIVKSLPPHEADALALALEAAVLQRIAVAKALAGVSGPPEQQPRSPQKSDDGASA